MTTSRILATSGGFVAGPVQGTVRLGNMIIGALASTKKDRPRVCLVETAGGDPREWYAMLYEAFNAAGCDVTELRLFTQPSADPTERLMSCDFVWVGGGSVANLLALWRLHGVDLAMREAWEKGVILAGVSAGSLCWHVGGTTDSFGPTLRPVTNGLGFLPYSNSPHHDAEAERRPLIHRLIADGTLPDGYAPENGTGLPFFGTELHEAFTEQPGRTAYSLTRRGDTTVETALPT